MNFGRPKQSTLENDATHRGSRFSLIWSLLLQSVFALGLELPVGIDTHFFRTWKSRFFTLEALEPHLHRSQRRLALTWPQLLSLRNVTYFPRLFFTSDSLYSPTLSAL